MKLLPSTRAVGLPGMKTELPKISLFRRKLVLCQASASRPFLRPVPCSLFPCSQGVDPTPPTPFWPILAARYACNYLIMNSLQ